MKRCTMCGETKAEDEFCRRKASSDGRNSSCRKCMSEKSRRYREENREAVLESTRRHYAETREAALEKNRRYREENREANRERDRRYREENRRITGKYAFKSGKFSPEEDLEVMRSDMTVLEIAIALGRTYRSVLNRRERLRKKENTNV